MRVAITDFNKHPIKYLNQAINELVIIEQSNQPIVVIRYTQLEDAYWGKLATQSDQQESLTNDETMNFLRNSE